MKKTNLLVALACGAALLSANAAIAGNRPGAITLTPGIGYYHFSSKRNLDNTAVLPTVGLAYNFDEKWAIEAAYGSLHTANQVKGVTGNTYSVTGLYRFAPYKMFEPYVSAGVGLLYLNPNASNPTNKGNINAGLGTQMFFSDSIALRGEVRDFYMTSGGYNDVMVNFGVSFLFGGNKPEAVALYK